MVSLLLIVPIIGAVVVTIGKREFAKWTALFFTSLELLLSLFTCFKFNFSASDFQFVEFKKWITDFSIAYKVGIDGLSLLMILMTTFITIIAVLSAWNYINTQEKLFYALLLCFEAFSIGVFVSIDLLLFFVFLETAVISATLMTGIWGNNKNTSSTTRFFVFSSVGSMLFFVGIVTIYVLFGKSAGYFTFDITELSNNGFSVEVQKILFWFFFLAIAFMIPVVPFHTGILNAIVESPIPGSILLAGILPKFGAYALLRVCLSLFPNAFKIYALPVSILGIITILYAVLIAPTQKNIKSVIAYGSISMMGFVLVGISGLNACGLKGSIIQMFSHGLVISGLFFIVGMINKSANLVTKISIFSVILVMALIGLPGTSSFVGELLTIIGSLKISKVIGLLTAFGIILSAVCLIYACKDALLKKPSVSNIKDVALREFIVLLSIVFVVIFVGIYPKLLLKLVHGYTKLVLEGVKNGI